MGRKRYVDIIIKYFEYCKQLLLERKTQLGS